MKLEQLTMAQERAEELYQECREALRTRDVWRFPSLSVGLFTGNRKRRLRPLRGKQTSLEREVLPNDPEPKRPWLGICSPGCWMAKGDKCQCKCGGLYHGRGRRKEVEKHEAPG